MKMNVIIYVFGIIVLSVILVVFNKSTVVNFYYGITIWSAILTIIMNIFNTFNEINRNKLKKAIELVKDFDNPELRKARDFTRKFKEDYNEEKIPKEKLADFIDGTLNQEETQKFMDKYNFNNKKEIYELKSSLIYMFNYFQSVYTIIEADMADKTYILKNMKNVYLQLFDRFKLWVKRNCETCDTNQYKDLEKLEELAINFNLGV